MVVRSKEDRMPTVQPDVTLGSLLYLLIFSTVFVVGIAVYTWTV
jgi:hypothetical protein